MMELYVQMHMEILLWTLEVRSIRSAERVKSFIFVEEAMLII